MKKNYLDFLLAELGGEGSGNFGHGGRPGEIGGSASESSSAGRHEGNLPGRARASTKAADLATKKALESGLPEHHAAARDAHIQAAKDNLNAYRDTQTENPIAAEGFKRAVTEHESTATIHDKHAGKYKINK